MLTAELLFYRQFLLLFGASENTIGYASDYMKIYAIGTIFVQMTLGMNMFITAQGFAKTGMLTVLIGAVCNIILDPIFIYGFDMGVRGAALATIISQAVSCSWCLPFLRGKKTFLRLRKEYLPLKRTVIVPCVLLGLATFIMQASESVIAVCFNSSLLKICMGYSIVLFAAIMLMPRVFAGIFSNDPALLDYAVSAIRIYCGALFVFGIQISAQLTFVSIGNAPCSIIVAVVRKFILLIPLIYIMPHLVSDPAKGVFMAEPIADFLAVCFTSILFYIQFRKALDKL